MWAFESWDTQTSMSIISHEQQRITHSWEKQRNLLTSRSMGETEEHPNQKFTFRFARFNSEKNKKNMILQMMNQIIESWMSTLLWAL